MAKPRGRHVRKDTGTARKISEMLRAIADLIRAVSVLLEALSKWINRAACVRDPSGGNRVGPHHCAPDAQDCPRTGRGRAPASASDPVGRGALRAPRTWS